MMSGAKKMVPKRRFKEFLNAGDWEQRKLGECMNSFAYGLNAAAKEYDGMHKYIRITDIDDETHNFIQSNLTSPDIDFNMDVSDYKLNIGDIVFARTGASVGKTYLYNPNDGDLYYAGFLIRGKVKDDCDAGFIYQNTLTKDYDAFIKITSQRSGQPGVNSKEYATFRLNIPCKDEQSKISKVLNSLDKLFTLHQRKLDKLQATKKALLQEMFPEEGQDKPKRRFKGFTDAWEQRKLSDITEVIMGQSPSSRNYTDNPNDSILVQGNADLKDGKVVPRLWTKEITKTIDKDGIILTVRAPVGDVAKTDYKVVLGRGVAGIKGNDYIYQFLQKLQNDRYWVTLSSGSTFESINSKDIKDLIINIPSKEEQTKISTLLNNVNSIITLHQRKLDKLKNLKRAYLNELFV